MIFDDQADDIDDQTGTGHPTLPDLSADLTVPAGMFSGLAGPVLVIDPAGGILGANPAACRLAPLINGDELAAGLMMQLGQIGLTEAGTVDMVEVPEGDQGYVFDVLALPLGSDGRRLLVFHDRTLEASLRAALIESRGRFKDLVEISSDFVWEVDGDGLLVYVSPKGALGYDARELLGRQSVTLLCQDLNGTDAFPFLTPARVDGMEVWMRRADGEAVCFLASAVPLLDSHGIWRGARGVCRDITELHDRDRALAAALNRERVFSRILRTFRSEVDPANMMQVAASTITHGMAASGCQIFSAVTLSGRVLTDNDMDLAASFGAVGPDRAVSTVLTRLKKASEPLELEVKRWQVLAAPTWYRDQRNGSVLLWRAPGRPLWSDEDRHLFTGIAGQIGIATEQIVAHQRLVRISRTDPLTGLLNRRAFYEELKRRFARVSRGHIPGALIYCDLDNFKIVNDVHGHQRGDEALLMLRDILYNNTRSSDLVARLGGDEFAVWLDNADVEIARKRAEVFISAAKSLRAFSGTADRPLHMSLGIAVYDPDRPEDMNSLMSRADNAMYVVKRSGKGDYAIAEAATRISGRDGQ